MTRFTPPLGHYFCAHSMSYAFQKCQRASDEERLNNDLLGVLEIGPMYLQEAK